MEPRAPRCEPAAAGGCGRPPLAASAQSPSTFVCAAAVADAALVGAGSPPLASPKPEFIDVSVWTSTVVNKRIGMSEFVGQVRSV